MEIPEFGIKRENEERRDGGCGIVFDPETKLFAAGRQENGHLRVFSGGVDAGEDLIEGILREVREESGLHDFKHVEKIAEAMAHYYNSLRKVNRVTHSTCLLVVLNSRDLVPVHLEEHEKFTLDWVTADDLIKDWQATNNNDNDHWFYFMDKALVRLKELGY